MATNWLVTFIDKGNCEIEVVQVNCYNSWNAPKVAFNQLSTLDVKNDTFRAESVRKEVNSIKVEPA